MIKRLAAAGAAAVVALTSSLAAPATAAPNPSACTSVELGLRGVHRPDSQFWDPWFDVTLRGRATSCRSPLAITQYHPGRGLMSAPWRTAEHGTTAFSRSGRIEPDVLAFCVSTGRSTRDGAEFADNAVCVRPVRSGADHLVTRLARVPLTDPVVSTALTAYPAAGTPPADPVCRAECLVSPALVLPGQGGPEETTQDTPSAGPKVPIHAYTSGCHTVSVTDTFAGPTDWNVNGFDAWLTGDVESCEPDGDMPTIYGVRYWPDRGIVMSPWQYNTTPLAKGSHVNEHTGAVCLASGMRERDGRLYGVHDRCWRIVRDQPDRYLLVAIRTDDPMVRKPLQSNLPLPDPDFPPSWCASCL
jgi:hypothetical protein